MLIQDILQKLPNYSGKPNSCTCDRLGKIGGKNIPHSHIETDEVSSNIRPDIKTDGYIQPRKPMIHFPEIQQPPEGKVNHVQVGNRLIIADGKGPLRYLDLTTNKVHVYQEPGERIPVRILKEIKPDTIIENRGGKAYLVKII